MPQLFWEARSKVERAEEHINDPTEQLASSSTRQITLRSWSVM
jgi:hypothetical protein